MLKSERLIQLTGTRCSVTFFALPNGHFPRPRHPSKKELDFQEALVFGTDFGDMLVMAEGLVNNNSASDKDTIKAFIKAILLYQTLPLRLSSFDLAKNLTHATSLTLYDGSLHGEPLRVRVSKGPGPSPLAVNLISPIMHPNIPATNGESLVCCDRCAIQWFSTVLTRYVALGLIHIITEPVLPPPSAFQITFALPEMFSTLVSLCSRSQCAPGTDIWIDVRSPARRADGCRGMAQCSGRDG